MPSRVKLFPFLSCTKLQTAGEYGIMEMRGGIDKTHPCVVSSVQSLTHISCQSSTFLFVLTLICFHLHRCLFYLYIERESSNVTSPMNYRFDGFQNLAQAQHHIVDVKKS